MVLFGPSMEDFREARGILVRTGAGIEVGDCEGLKAGIDQILSCPDTYSILAAKGRDEILTHVGSSGKNAELLARLLQST
jgi:3-deoxy-D-manno-octulosonic-acid transferase